MNIDGSEETQLTFNPIQDLRPVFSPDGKKIAFQSDRNGNYEIFIGLLDSDETAESQTAVTITETSTITVTGTEGLLSTITNATISIPVIAIMALVLITIIAAFVLMRRQS